MDNSKKIVVLISGRGSNLQAIINSKCRNNISLVISNNHKAYGLQIAQIHNIPTLVIEHQKFLNRADFEKELICQIDKINPQLIVLAGFMRILTNLFIEHYLGKIINVHPALLPCFPGLDTHNRALSAGVSLHGCTVHFVDSGVDSGRIIAQGAVAVLPTDNEQSIANRVLAVEHKILPKAVEEFLEEKYFLDINSDSKKIVWKTENNFDKFKKNQDEFLISPFC